MYLESHSAFTQKLWDFGRILELEGVSKYNYSRDRWRVVDPSDYMKLSHPIPELGLWGWGVSLYASMDSIKYA